MSQGQFSINGKSIRDMSEAELLQALERASDDSTRAAAEFNLAIQKVQVSTAVVNVLRYEIHRRANSIQVAHSIPH